MTFSWLRSSNRKVHQHRMNKLMRLMNENIASDDLWAGRYVVSQIGAQWFSYEDHSGHELWVVLRFTDRLTGRTWDQAETVNHWAFVNGHHLWEKMNTFIVEVCDTWTRDPRPGTPAYDEMINGLKNKEGQIQWPY